MSTVNYHVLNASIVVNYDGKTQVVSRDDSRYSKVLACIREGRLADIPGEVEVERAFEGSGIELRDGLLYENDTPLPGELSKRILMHRDEGLPYKPLFNLWDRLKQNPSFNARRMLFAFLEHNGHPLTEDGKFIAYRGVNDEFKDMHTGKWDNSPGSICEMPRDQVDDNPNNTCSHGLHVACFDYAKGFGPRLVEVKVDPADVVAVPTDYNGTKMRVCRFEVIQECASMRTELVYGQESEADAEDHEDCDHECGVCEDADETEDFDGSCINCGEENDDDAKYCKGCGDDLGNSDT